MRENLHGRILKGGPNEQHLSTIPKSCFFLLSHKSSFQKKGLSHKNKNVLFKKK